MIPAPPNVPLPPAAAADAPLLRAAEVALALRAYGQVRIPEACIQLWPTLRRLDLAVLAREAGGTVRQHWDDPSASLVLRVAR